MEKQRKKSDDVHSHNREKSDDVYRNKRVKSNNVTGSNGPVNEEAQIGKEDKAPRPPSMDSTTPSETHQRNTCRLCKNEHSPVDEQEALLKAVAGDDAEAVLHWLAMGANVDGATNGTAKMPLFVAIKAKSRHAMRVILDHGADVNRANQHGWTPLFHASPWGNVDIVEELVRRGADVDRRCSNQQTALCRATAWNKVLIMKTLIQHGANVHNEDISGRTPLFSAHNRSNVEAAQLLIEHGADIHHQDHCGMTPVFVAGGVKTAALFIQYGVDVNHMNIYGETPVLSAMQRGRYGAASTLQQHGGRIADVESALTYALEHRQGNAVSFLRLMEPLLVRRYGCSWLSLFEHHNKARRMVLAATLTGRIG